MLNFNIKKNNSIWNRFDYLNYFKQKETKFYNSIIEEIKNEFELIDKNIRNSKTRITSGYLIKGYVPRTIITTFGKLTFTRTKYIFFDKKINKHRTIFLVDNVLKIERYQRISINLKLAIIKELASGKRQRDIKDQFKAANITRASISNITKSINIEKLCNISAINYLPPLETKDKPYIYLNVDDTFISLRKNKIKSTYRIRLAVAHLGHVDAKISRKQLLQKRAFYLIEKVPIQQKYNLKEYAGIIFEQLNFFYGDIKNKKIIVCGDGAQWIEELAVLLNAEYVLDKFHVCTVFFKAFPYQANKKSTSIVKKNNININNEAIYQNLVKLLVLGESKQIIISLKNLLVNRNFIAKRTKINSLIKYIKNHENGISSYQQPYYIGSQSEAMISHLVKSLKGYGAKLYSFESFVNLLNLRIAEINNLKPIEIYYKQCNFNENYWMHIN